MFEILKLLTKKASCNAKKNIDAKLNTIKNAIDWSNFEVDICTKIDLTDLYQDNQLNENAIWNNIAKLSIDLYLDYDYYKDFVFLDKHKGEEYDYRLRMLGYEEENGYWTSRRKPEKDLVIEYVFISCLYRSIGRRLTIEQQRNGEEADISDPYNVIRTLSNSGDNARICPFCDFELSVEEKGCRHCEATEEDIATLFPNATEPIDDRVEIQTITLPIRNQLLNDVISESRISLSPPEPAPAPLKSGDDCTGEEWHAACIKLVGDEPILNTVELTAFKDNLKSERKKRIKKKGPRTNTTKPDHSDQDRDFFRSEEETKESEQSKGMRSLANSTSDTGSRVGHAQSPQVSSCCQSNGANSESSSWAHHSWGGQQQQAHASLYSPQSGHHEVAYSNFYLHASSADTGHPVTVTARNNQCCNDGVAEPLDNPIASDIHNNQGVSTLPGHIHIDRVGSVMNSANGWRCESCGMENDESFLSCQACSVARVTKWTCMYCNIDYKVSIRKCAQCDRDWEGAPKRRFCTWCRESEVLGNGVCEDCAATQWRCWRSGCQGRNYGRGHYCGYCGVDKDGDRTPGQPIRVLIHGQIDTKWICSQCGVMNAMSVTQCRCGQCRGARYPTGTSSVSTGYPIGQPGKEVIINDARPEPAPRDSLYPSVSAFARTELWSCKQCEVGNESSSNKCIGCGKSRFCLRCGLEENIEEGLCAACVAARWRCWYRPCESANFGKDKQNCEKCGLARQAPRVSGESLWRNVHGSSRLVWVCDRCYRINENYNTSCSGSRCEQMRNKDFVWCTHCGFGNPPKWFDSVYKKCKACDRSV